MTKPTKWNVRPVKTQISLGIYPVSSESSLCGQWVAKDQTFLHADSKDPDETGPMPSWSESLLGAHAILLVFLWGGSYLGYQLSVPYYCLIHTVTYIKVEKEGNWW